MRYRWCWPRPAARGPRSPAPRPHPGPNPKGPQPLTMLTHVGVRLAYPGRSPRILNLGRQPATARSSEPDDYSSRSRLRRRAGSVAAVIAVTASAPGRA